jgi:branched-chain amino acid transport system substrate-binding protein
MAEWATKNGIKKVVTIVTDYAPGIDAEKAFSEPFVKAGGKVENVACRCAIRLRAVPAARGGRKADALFVFVPSGVGSQLMKQYVGARPRQVRNPADRSPAT